jgi:uncharacterized membrane protein YdjX (TVP38/TMEM64 family)
MDDTTRTETETDTSTGTRPLARLAAGVLLLLVLFAAGRLAGGYLPAARTWVAQLGPWGPFAFVALYAVATVAFVPASLLTLAAGAIFGVAFGTTLVLVAATLGASAAFLIARYVARASIERRLRDDGRFRAIDRAVADEGLKIVTLLRLSPVFPFNLLNYALGLTGVRFGDYFVACLGMLPGTLMYVYLGALGGDVAAAAAEGNTRSNAEWGLLALGLVATVAVTVSITRIARRALREATQ